MKKLFIIHENDKWAEPLLVQLLNLIANFLKKELEKTN